MVPYSEITIGQRFYVYFNDADEGEQNEDCRILCERREPMVFSNCVADGWNLEDDLPMEIDADCLVEPVTTNKVS
jgi:hypothetical protein